MRAKERKGFIFVISGTSGSGKTTLANRIIKQPQLKGKFIKSISFTTRPRRPSEKEGRDYLFVSTKEYQRLLKAKKILEHTRYLGYDYGTSRKVIEEAIDKGLNIVLCLDIKGALFLKKKYPGRTITIFVKPPSMDMLKQRILGRCAQTSHKELIQRLRLARQEVGCARYYDFSLVNDNLNKAIKEIVRIIKWAIRQ